MLGPLKRANMHNIFIIILNSNFFGSRIFLLVSYFNFMGLIDLISHFASRPVQSSKNSSYCNIYEDLKGTLTELKCRTLL